jgi:hypothetical protein
MNIIESKIIEVISMSPYEHVHYLDDTGRNFLSLHQEVGFAGYSESIILTDEESVNLNQDKAKFIKQLISTFDSKTNTFKFHNNQRHIPEFRNWACVKVAIDKWHGRTGI